MRVVVSYDISNDKRRRKVAKILEGVGYRVQYSVFECELSKKQLVQLRRRLRPLVRQRQEESIRFYPLLEESKSLIDVVGYDWSRILGQVEIV